MLCHKSMVLSFTPPLGNSTHPCSELDDYNAHNRPVKESSAEFLWPSMVAAMIVVGGGIVALIGIIYYRNNPRFFKVRPLRLSFLTIIALNAYMLAGIAAIPLQWPCIVPVVLYPASVTWLSCGLVFRALRLSLDAHLARKMNNVVELGYRDVAASGSINQEDLTLLSTASMHSYTADLKAMVYLFRVAFGNRDMSTMGFDQVVMSKRVFAWFALTFALPGFVTGMILIIALPQARGECVEHCVGIFLELPITLVALLMFYFMAVLQSLRVAYNNVGWNDNHGAMFELTTTVLTMGVLCVGVWLLVLFDPDDLELNRTFNWHLLFLPPGTVYWINAFGLQFYKAHRINMMQRKAAVLDEEGLLVDMTRACEADAELKREFREFATKQFCIELVLFLDDCRAYKQMFYDKSESWRLSKARLLVKMYIASGADMEINISDELKRRILSQYELSTTANLELFDNAMQQVETMIQYGVWVHFQAMKRKTGQKPTKMSNLHDNFVSSYNV